MSPFIAKSKVAATLVFGLASLAAAAVLTYPARAATANTAETAASIATVQATSERPRDLEPTPIAEDPTVKWDYPIVYVRISRQAHPLPMLPTAKGINQVPPGADLVMLYPDGREEVLVRAAAQEAIVDPAVSFDGEWLYYVRMYGIKLDQSSEMYKAAGSHIYKVHVPTRKVVQLTQGGFTPNTGSKNAAKNPFLSGRGVFNLGPQPLPGGKVIFTSDRNVLTSAPGGPNTQMAQQLFVMDDDGSNVEGIGHLNLGSVMHPVVLEDGRVMFSTNETQGLRGAYSAWGLWTIHPDGTHWEPLLSAFLNELFHFQTQLSDGRIVVGNYYDGTDRGFGRYLSFPAEPPEGQPGFAPAWGSDPRNAKFHPLMKFAPSGVEWLTLFATGEDFRPNSGLGQFRDPAAAPDNHLMTAWPKSVFSEEKPSDDNRNGMYPTVAFDSGIYLIKSGKAIDEPGKMLLIKNDPNYHELMPRAVVPYRRIHGTEEPGRLPSLLSDGTRSKHLPAGTPFGLVGSSSLYKRESYPNGVVPPGKVTATYSGRPDVEDGDAFRDLGGYYGRTRNWLTQGADAGLYDNSDIHAIRILLLEPVTNTGYRQSFWGHGTNTDMGGFAGTIGMPTERFRVLGEFPVRKFQDGRQSIDPDGNPDSSFLAKVPADVAWTFQTLDKRGMVLNMSQTWHQVRPGEIRNDCGGCHAHSQPPTDFTGTGAAKPDYPIWDLTRKAPLLTTKANDETGRQWDVKSETGVRFVERVTNVEFFRDVKPILDRSCAACHTKTWDKPAGNLVLDDDEMIGNFPGTYVRLAQDHTGRYGNRLLTGGTDYGGVVRASRYVQKLQSRRSLLIWKVFGERLDGWSNDDHPTEDVPGDMTTLKWKGALVPADQRDQFAVQADLDYTGSIMPPPEAVAGTYRGPDGKPIRVAPLSDEDKLTLVRWIDIGCPIDLDYNPAKPNERGSGWMLDDQRPTLTLTYPQPGLNEPLRRILVGMHDYDSGLDTDNFQVVADFRIDGVPAGRNLARGFKALPDNRWELQLTQPISDLPRGKLTVSIKDKQGNVTVVERTFSVVSTVAR